MGALAQDSMSGTAPRGTVMPFRMDADDLVAMFQTIDAGTPAWHRARARTLMREAKLHPVAAVNAAWSRLAARHIATAMLLERQQAPVVPSPEAVARRRRFFRD